MRVQLVAQRRRILSQLGVPAEGLQIAGGWRQHAPQRRGDVSGQHLGGLPAQHTPAAGREAGGEARRDPAGFIDLQAGSLEDRLARSQDVDLSALAGPPRSAG